jgi:hypothetical protein
VRRVGSAALGHAPGVAPASAYEKATYFARRVEYVGFLADRFDVLEAGTSHQEIGQLGVAMLRYQPLDGRSRAVRTARI